MKRLIRKQQDDGTWERWYDCENMDDVPEEYRLAVMLLDAGYVPPKFKYQRFHLPGIGYCSRGLSGEYMNYYLDVLKVKS